jgi:hypothetical protein
VALWNEVGPGAGGQHHVFRLDSTGRGRHSKNAVTVNVYRLDGRRIGKTNAQLSIGVNESR